MAKKNITPWVEIKAKYLKGATPKELAEEYELIPRKISDKVNKEKWAQEKAEICVKVRETTEERIKGLTNLALETLENVIKDSETEKNVKVQACRTLLDISGLKSAKVETTNINTEPIKVEFVK